MQHMIGRRIPCCLFVALLLAAPARGEGMPAITFVGESRAAALRLAEARKRLDEHKWSEAIEELQSLRNSAGDDLVSIAPNHSVRAGWLCQVQLASLPAEALHLYRQRYEAQAGKKLQQAQAERDIAQLRKLVEDAFCTRAAEKAIDLLGDLAFERGRFAEAEEWWRLLAPLPDGRTRPQRKPGDVSLVYPDLSLDPARIQAKQLLAQLFEDPAASAAGSPSADSEWTAALETYRQRHAKAEGTLAGRKGRYADLLQALAKEMQNAVEIHRFARNDKSPPHSGDILDRLADLIGQGPTWRFNLEQRSRQEEPVSAPAVNAAEARKLAFYPVIAGPHVLVADARYVTAFDVRNGKSEKWYDVAERNGGVNPNLKLPAPVDLRYTLTVSGEHVYARLGAQDIGVEAPRRRRGPPPPRRDNETFLACLSLRPDEKGGHFRWKIGGITPRESILFEGSPLVADGLVWIASTHYSENRCFTAIDCYPADDSSAPPLRWRCEVCESSDVKAGEPRYRHHRLTRAGTQIVYCTHTGGVVAVDALTGRRNWAIRYPRRRIDREEPELRDLNPVLFAAGRLYVAAADSDTLLCLDPATGRTLWELELRRVVHLLGIGQGRLIFTTPTGLRAVRAENGNPDWTVPDTGDLTPAGRGLLIGDLVLFPTTGKRAPDAPRMESVVYAICQSNGRPADDPANLHRLPAGNLAYANGILAVADQETLSVFVPPRLLPMERKAEAQTRTPPPIEKQKNLLRMAQRAAESKRWQDTENSLEQAATISLPPRYRLHALLRAAQIWKNAKQADRAAAVWESIRADKSLRDVPMIDRRGRPTSVAAQAREERFIGSRETINRPSPLSNGSRRTETPSLPLFRSWHVRMDSDEWILAGWNNCDPEWILSGSLDGRLNCRSTSTGEIRWTHRLPFAPSWAGCHADTILAAGAAGVACLSRENGQRLWYFPVPVAGRSPRASSDDFRVVLDPQPPQPLSDFRLVSGRLFFLQGQRRLFALNAETGAVLWDRWAPDAQLHLPFPRGCFSTCYHAGAEFVLIQMPGRRWLLDAATGRSLHEAADSRDLWQHPPLELDEHTLCLTPDSRHITLLDARTGQCLWTHRLTGATTRSGEIPSVLGRDKVLLCVQPANIGYFLQRLDRASGNAVWLRPQLLETKAVDRSAWTFDADAVYSIEDRWLTARSLADGAIRWRQPLPPGSWQAQRVGDYLAVSPRVVGSEMRFRFRPPLGAVQWDLGPLLAPEAVFPLSCYDPKTGQLVQRLHFRIESPVRTTLAKQGFQQEGGRAWMARSSSLLASADGPVIRLDVPRPFVAIGGEVWGLSATLDDKDSTANARH